MRSAFLSSLLFIGILAAVHTVSARLVGTNPGTDVFCVGGTPSTATNEICVDATGNIVPTTTGVSSLGTSSLAFKDLYVSGALTLAAGAIDTAKIATDAVTTSKIAAGQVDTSKIKTAVADTSKIMVSCGGVALWRTGGTCP